MTRHKQRHISGWPAVLLIPIAIPIVLLVKLGELIGLLKSTEDLTAEDVESYLQDFLDARGGDWDWDDFTSIPITDPALEAIRREAADLDLPLRDEGRLRLEDLVNRAQALKR